MFERLMAWLRPSDETITGRSFCGMSIYRDWASVTVVCAENADVASLTATTPDGQSFTFSDFADLTDWVDRALFAEEAAQDIDRRRHRQICEALRESVA